jgi:predicted DNA-binding transcriptional regulator AlpA
MSKLLTLSEAAEAIHLPEATLRYWVSRDTTTNGPKQAPPSFKLGRRRMFRAEDIEAWIDAQVQRASA